MDGQASNSFPKLVRLCDAFCQVLESYLSGHKLRPQIWMARPRIPLQDLEDSVRFPAEFLKSTSVSRKAPEALLSSRPVNLMASQISVHLPSWTPSELGRIRVGSRVRFPPGRGALSVPKWPPQKSLREN